MRVNDECLISFECTHYFRIYHTVWLNSCPSYNKISDGHSVCVLCMYMEEATRKKI